MVTPFDSSLTSSTLDTWQDTNAGVGGSLGAYSFYTDPVGEGYDKIALTTLASQASDGGYFRVDTGMGSPSYTYIGLTQSLTSSTQTVGQNASSIDFGIKIEPGFLVWVVINGEETQVIGQYTPAVYTVIFDGTSGFAVFKNNSVVYTISLSQLQALGVNITLSNPLNLGFVSYSSDINIPFDAGGVTNLNLQIGNNGPLDPISDESSYTLDTVTGILNLSIKLSDTELPGDSYTIEQLDPFPVFRAVSSSDLTPVNGFLSLTTTNIGFIGADIVVTKISNTGVQSLPRTVTNKTLLHNGIHTAGVSLVDIVGTSYKSIALLLSGAYTGEGVTHIALIDPNLYTPSIESLGQLDATSHPPADILELDHGLAKFNILSNSTRLVVPGSIDASSPNVLNINPNVRKFSIYGGSIGTIFDVPAIESLSAAPFQNGTDANVTVDWLNDKTSTTFAVFTQDVVNTTFYRTDRLNLIAGYDSTKTSLNDVLTLTTPQNSTYYIFPVQTNTDNTIGFLSTGSSITLQGTSTPQNVPPYAPSVTLVDTATTPGSLIVEWVPLPGDDKGAESVSFTIAFKNTNGDVVKTVSSITQLSVTESDLPAGDYTFVLTSVSASGLTASTLDQQFTITGGGGSPTGGQGNTGSNGHNNMAAALEYRYPDWSVDVSQTQTITVLGEESGALTADETIVINVPLNKFKQCLAYKSTWDASLTGTEAGSQQPLPEVALRLAVDSAAAKTEIDAMFVKLKGSPTGALSSRTMDDDASATHDAFSKRLADGSVTFANSVFDSVDLPKVAIRSISEGEISAEELSTTLAKVTTANAPHKAYLEGLFEQAVAEGRVKKDDIASDEGAGWKAPSFAVGDSLSVLVKYNFKQTRVYEVDGLDSAGGNSAAKALTLTIGGATFTIQAGDDGKEDSEDTPGNSRTYEFKLVATA